MLNPAFSRSVTDYDDTRYILGQQLINQILSANSGFNTGKEWRLQEIYGYEIWKKLTLSGLGESCWKNRTVLDICSGTGFLSYHILKKVQPKKIVLLDISDKEVGSAKELLSQTFQGIDIEYLVSDAINTGFRDEMFDIVIGNSFLHHFYNLPKAILEFKRILKPDGIFLSVHEPTVPAVALEGGSLFLLAAYFLLGDGYVDLLRFKGQGIAPGGGQDVWIFNDENMRNILLHAGMKNISIRHFHLLRSFFVGKCSLHLNEKKPTLSEMEIFLLKKSINTDIVLSKYLPHSVFGSITISATK